MFATRARRGVENARLGLDATKAKGKGGKGEEDLPMSDEHRAEVERKEDDFVGVTEDAVGVMKNVRCALFHGDGFPLPEYDFANTVTYAGPRHAGASSQPRRSHRRAAGVSQESLRDLERAGACGRWPSGRAGGELQVSWCPASFARVCV